MENVKETKEFLSTPSGWRATSCAGVGCVSKSLISIHALRVEGDREVLLFGVRSALHFYPRPPGGGRQQKARITIPTEAISIHALRVEGDSSPLTFVLASSNFYPRPPGGGRLRLVLKCRAASRFLSTPSGWRATSINCSGHHLAGISIHALRVEGDGLRLLRMGRRSAISIHALRVEGDASFTVRAVRST